MIVTHSLRQALPLQLEVLIQAVYVRPLKGSESKVGTPTGAGSGAAAAALAAVQYDLKEMVLESLLDLCRLPWFFPELYLNYDCNPQVPFTSPLHPSQLSASCVHSECVPSV